jgi:hypothetical protein
MKSTALRPGDVAIALQLSVSPANTLAETAHFVGRSIGEVHNATRRLASARLLDAGERTVHTGILTRFIRYGVPHAFPPTFGGPAVGMGTATGTAEPWVAEGSVDFVWPHARGAQRGTAVAPLYPLTPEVVERNRMLWHLLSLVDTVRIGGAREADAAIGHLAKLLEAAPAQ